MFSVPSPIKRVFDSVPLQVYKNGGETVQPHNLYSFSKVSELGSGPTFVVGVYNTFEYRISTSSKDSVILPTDPISLATILILARKNDYGLPSSGAKGPSGIVRIPFRGSPFNSLPILISGDETRSIESAETIKSTITKNNIKNLDLKFISDYVDKSLYDLWILCLLAEELDISVYSKIFSINDQLELHDLKTEMVKWNNLSLRHPSLFERQQKHKNMYNFYISELDQFDTNINWFSEILEKPEGDNWIIYYKIASFVIIVDQFLQSTKLGAVVVGKPDLVAKCYKVLESI